MAEIRDYFPEISKLELHELHARREAILSAAGGNYKDLADEPLSELFAISRALRKKAAIGTAPRKPRAAKAPATLEDLA